MTRNLKVFGLALAAVFTMSAVVATAASAQGTLTSDGPVTLKGAEAGGMTATFKAFGIAATCPGSTATGHAYNVTPHGLIPSGATTITVTPHIKQIDASGKMNCKAAGFPATLHMNGCDGVVHIGGTTGAADTYTGTGDLVCPPGKEVELTVFTTEAEDPSTAFCTLRGAPQTGLSGAVGIDKTNGTIELKGPGNSLHVTRTNHGAHGLLCPNNTTTNTGSAEFIGLVSGVNALGNPTSISLSHP